MDLLSQVEKDKPIVLHYKSNQADLLSHQTNLDRYNTMLQTLPEGQFKTRIENLKAQTEERIFEVETIQAAMLPQMPSQDRIDAVLADLINNPA